MMQIDKLEYFLEVARTGSINQAAQNLNISHQALNQAIHLMEKELGVKLFESNRKGTSLTANGELVRNTAECVLESWGCLRQTIAAVNGEAETIRIGFIPYYERLFYAVQRNMQRKYPHVKLTIQNTHYAEAIPLLMHHELDLAFVVMLNSEITELLASSTNLEYTLLKSVELDVLVNVRSPLAAYESLDWSHLRGVPIALMILGDRGTNHLMRRLQGEGMDIMFVHTEQMLHELVAENQACYFIPRDSIIPEYARGKVKRIAFYENLASIYGILCRKDDIAKQNMITLIEMIKVYCK